MLKRTNIFKIYVIQGHLKKSSFYNFKTLSSGQSRHDRIIIIIIIIYHEKESGSDL